MLPIYGFGATILLHVSLPLYNRPVALFFASMAAATAFEYVVGVIMEKPVQHVCSVIGKRHGKTENSVERAMQNAINRTWAGADKDELLAHYTAKIKSRKGVPTITEFIYFYAQKLNNEF